MSLLDNLKKQQTAEKDGQATGQAQALMQRMRDDMIDRDAVVLLVTQIEVAEQARKTFKKIDTLAENIAKHGQLQPIIVVETSNPNRFKLAYGERRLRAIRDVLKQDTIFARIKKDINEAAQLRLSQLSENIHRSEYEPLELAAEFQFLMDENNWTQSDLAAKLSLTQGWVSKKLSLLKAPQEVQELIRNGELSETDYYNNKQAVKKEVENIATAREKPDGSAPPSDKPKTLSIPFTQAVRLAGLIKTLAEKQGITGIEISPEPTKKELQAIIGRIDELKEA